MRLLPNLDQLSRIFSGYGQNMPNIAAFSIPGLYSIGSAGFLHGSVG
jgi:hypothetical protein